MYDYDFLNVYNGRQSPGTIHAASSSLGAYFRRYLFQKVSFPEGSQCVRYPVPGHLE